MLIERMSCQCRRLIPTSVADGKGGQTVVYSEGESFMAAIILNSGAKTSLAEKPARDGTYLVMVDKTINLALWEIFKRLSDNRTFRVIGSSSERQTPAGSALNLWQAEAEVCEL